MEWEEYLKSTIGLIAEAKRKYQLLIDNEGNPEHESIESKIMNVKALGDVTPHVFPINYFHANRKIASLDSSTRYLRDLSVNTCIVGLSVYSNVKNFIFGPINIKTPYMGISSYTPFLKEIESYLPSSLIRVKNKVDYYYVNEPENEYKLDDIADELRTESETVGLQEALKDHEYVIADGPIYPTPLELTEQIALDTEARKMHRIAYGKLVNERIQILNGKVVGVVKRLENSEKLYSVNEIKKMIGNTNSKDVTILEMLDEKYCKSDFPYICVIGPFEIQYNLKVDYEGKIVLDNAPPKYSYYVIIRRNKMINPTFLRLESISEKMTKEPEDNDYLHVVLSSISEKTLLPTYIEIVDRMSKRLTKAMFVYAFELASGKLNIVHDDKLTYIRDITEQTE